MPAYAAKVIRSPTTSRTAPRYQRRRFARIGTMSPSEGSGDAGTSASGAASVPQGERDFGRYRLRYQLGAGGMATVYLGQMRGAAGFERPVAIKRIHGHLSAKKEFVEMFLDEARIAALI